MFRSQNDMEQSGPPSKLQRLALEISENRVFLCLSVIIVAVSIFIYFPTVEGDYDIWFHLRYGEHFVKNFTWDIDHSVYSWTPADKDWKYVSWLGSVICYLAFQAASMPGLYVLLWLILLSLLLLFLVFLKSCGESPDINTLALIMVTALAINLVANIVKPESFSLLFFGIAIFLYFFSKLNHRNLFLCYPVLFLLWVNTHGGFIFGLLFITLILVAETVGQFINRKESLGRDQLAFFALMVFLSFAATLMNPHGIAYHKELANNIIFSSSLQEATWLYAYANLWEFLFPHEYLFRFVNTAWAMLFMALSFSAITLYAFMKKRYLDMQLVVVNAIFFYIGMKVIRASIFFPVLWLFSLAYILKKSELLEVKKRYTLLSCIIIAICFSTIFYNSVVYQPFSSWLGLRFEETIPAREAEFIRENNVPGPFFNDYITGAYIIWTLYPEQRAFIDPRYGPYSKEVINDYNRFRIEPNADSLKALRAKYPFNAALVRLKEMGMITVLMGAPDWRLLYFDKIAAVFVHSSVIPALDHQKISKDLGADRFSGIDNPVTLSDIFTLYVIDLYMHINVDPEKKLDAAKKMLALYKKNVWDVYHFKKVKIAFMEQSLSLAEDRLRREASQR